MNLAKSYVYTMIPLFSDITALYCFFLFFSAAARSGPGMMTFYFPGFLLCACAAALINCLLARKDRTVFAIAASNIAVAAATAALMFYLPHSISGFTATFFAALIFLYPAVRSLLISRLAVTAATMLSYCEFSIIGTGFFLFIQQGVLIPEGTAVRLCVTAMLLNLLALSTLRMGGGKKNVQTGTAISRGVIFAAVTAFSFTVAWLMSLFFPAFKDATLYVLSLLWGFVLTILRAVRDFIIFLFSLLPETSREIMAGDPMDAAAVNYDLAEEEALQFPVIFFVAAAAAVVIILAYFLYRFRKRRIKAMAAAGDYRNERAASPTLLSLLLSALKRLFGFIKFIFWLLINFNTYSGVFIRLEYRGRRLGLPRRASETPREFLAAMSRRFAQQNEELEGLFLNLADQIDRQCFSGKQEAAARKMSREQIKAIFLLCKRKTSYLPV